MRRVAKLLGLMALIAFGVYWGLTLPRHSDAQDVAAVTPDPTRGEVIFYAAGCKSCHTAEGAEGEEALKLGGGQKFPSPYGTFVAPNISPDPEHGIGSWSRADFVSAVRFGTSPSGQHYFPAFPYASYIRMSDNDAVSLWAFMQTLPPVATPNAPHEIAFPFNIRRNLGVWKTLYLDDGWILDGDLSAEEARGRYLVEGPGHCAECHTPRDALGGLDTARWMAGAPNPSGRGTIPNLTPAKLDWSEADIAEYLTSGFTPDYDTAGGHMVKVIENTARLSDADRQAIVAYLKALPGRE
ncbi:MAG: c-type cytochrome [Paracoccaceae bacterium]